MEESRDVFRGQNNREKTIRTKTVVRLMNIKAFASFLAFFCGLFCLPVRAQCPTWDAFFSDLGTWRNPHDVRHYVRMVDDLPNWLLIIDGVPHSLWNGVDLGAPIAEDENLDFIIRHWGNACVNTEVFGQTTGGVGTLAPGTPTVEPDYTDQPFQFVPAGPGNVELSFEMTDGTPQILLQSSATLYVKALFQLTVELSPGTMGTPATTDFYVAQTTVPYSYSAGTCYQNLVTSLDGSPVSNAGSVLMDQDHTLATSAELMQFDVVVGSTPGGHTDRDGTNSVNCGSEFTITAIPDLGWEFYQWSGDASGATNPLSIPSVTSELTITANFQPEVWNPNWDFENWTSVDPPPGFAKNVAADFTVTQETSNANSGASSAALHWTTSSNRDLVSLSDVPVVVSQIYTVHMWFYDDDPQGRTRPVARVLDSGGSALETLAGSYTTDQSEWREHILELVAATGAVTVQPFVRVYDVAPFVSATISTDDWAVTEPFVFNISDGATDGEAIEIAQSSDGTLHAAINNAGVLYVSAPRAEAGQGFDRFVYVWVGGVGVGTAPPPWGKAGQVADSSTGYLFALMQEESSGYCEWRKYEGAAWTAVTGADCHGSTSPRLEGALDLVAHISGATSLADVPIEIWFSSGLYGTSTGQTLDAASQIPASTDGNANIEENETISWHRVAILAGKLTPEEM